MVLSRVNLFDEFLLLLLVESRPRMSAMLKLFTPSTVVFDEHLVVDDGEIMLFDTMVGLASVRFFGSSLSIIFSFFKG